MKIRVTFISPLLLLVLLLSPFFKANADSSLTVPVTDQVYAAVDLVIAHGLAGDVIIGQRPYSRSEIGRIFKNAIKKFENFPPDVREKKGYLGRVLDKYAVEYRNEISGEMPLLTLEPLKKMSAGFLYNKSRAEAALNGRGIGNVDGLITSFDGYQEGRTYVDGGNSFIITQHDMQVSKYFSLAVRPQFEFTFPKNEPNNGYAHILNLYAKTGFKNFELEVGRDSLLLGQGEFGGMLLTDNARPLDMIKITNPHPWQPPWIFKYLGHLKFTFFVSNLGPKNHFPYAYFYGLKATIKPVDIFEFGFGETIILGGRGAPAVSFTDVLVETFPFIKAGNNSSYSDTSDHRFGIFDMRLTIPPLRNSVLYWDSFFDDSPLRAWDFLDNLWNQMSFATGVYVPRLTDSGDLALRVEFQRVSPFSYRHSTWKSGYTLDRRFLGSNLGTDGIALYSSLKWFYNTDLSMTLRMEFEDRYSNTYYVDINSHGGGDRLRLKTHGPDEKRYRTMISSEWKLNDRVTLMPQAGYEYVTNSDFQEGRSVNNFIAGAFVSLAFDDFDFVIQK